MTERKQATGEGVSPSKTIASEIAKSIAFTKLEDNGRYKVDRVNFTVIDRIETLTDNGQIKVILTLETNVELIENPTPTPTPTPSPSPTQSSSSSTNSTSSQRKQATGEGISPDYSLSKELARRNAQEKLADDLDNYNYQFTNTTTIDEKAYRLDNGDYKIVLTIETDVIKLPKPPTSTQEAPPNVFEIETEIYAPEEKVEPTQTPPEVTKETEQETEKKEKDQEVTKITQVEPEVTTSQVPPELEPVGKEKLAIVLNKKRSELKRTLIPLIVNLASIIGIKAIEKAQSELPSCLPANQLTPLIISRNNIVGKLNTAVQVTDSLSKVLIGTGLVLGITSQLVKTYGTLRTTLKTTATTIPTVSGAPDPGNIALVNSDNLKGLEEKTIKQIQTISGGIVSIGLSLTLFNAILVKILDYVKKIDAYLVQCSNDDSLLTPISPILLQLEQINQQVQTNEELTTSYNGFTLEIVEVPFSPTVNRRKAVAKNSQNIILLETPLSFTTNDQTLINQLKLLIDENNLKAY